MATVPARRLRERPPLRRPTDEEIEQAREAIRRLDSAPGSGADRAKAVRLAIRDEDGSEGELELPPLAVALLEQVLDELSRGNAVAVESVPRLLEVHQAAELLGVSRPFVIGLIENGELPCQTVDDCRKIVFEDLMAYKQKNFEERGKILDELVAEAQALGLGY